MFSGQRFAILAMFYRPTKDGLTQHQHITTAPVRPCGEPDEQDQEDGDRDDQDQEELEPGGQAAGGQHAVHVVVRGVVDVIVHVVMHVVVDVFVHAETSLKSLSVTKRQRYSISQVNVAYPHMEVYLLPLQTKCTGPPAPPTITPASPTQSPASPSVSPAPPIVSQAPIPLSPAPPSESPAPAPSRVGQ